VAPSRGRLGAAVREREGVQELEGAAAWESDHATRWRIAARPQNAFEERGHPFLARLSRQREKCLLLCILCWRMQTCAQ
jgi:hypothetical protein